MLTDQLQQTEVRLDERQASFSSQVRVLDKVEARSSSGLLLTSHSFSQFMQRLSDIKQAADGTHQTAVALKTDRDLLTAQRAELHRQRLEQAAIVARIEEQRQALEQEYSIQNSITLQLYGLGASLGRQQADLVNQAGTVTAGISNVEAELQSLLNFAHGQGGNVVAPSTSPTPGATITTSATPAGATSTWAAPNTRCGRSAAC